MTNSKNIHPGIPQMLESLQKGKISRREFLRNATLLGMSTVVASQLAGLGWAPKVMASQVKRGGTIRVCTQVQKLTHPSTLTWIQATNAIRHVAEYLTYTDKDNITHPYLLESWQASDDLKTWTLNLRKGIKFNNGDLFNANDVIFTMAQWFDKDVGSAIKGLMGSYLDAGGLEKVNDHQVKLNLKAAEIAVPEHLFHFSAFMLNHRTFQGDFLKAPHGTGAFTIESYNEGEQCVLKARKDYWQKDLPYVDAIEFIDMGSEIAPQAAAMRDGNIDVFDTSGTSQVSVFKALEKAPEVNVIAVKSNWTRVLRMRADIKPFDNLKIRQALMLCQNREKALQLAFFGKGMLGQDTHVSPKNPEYCKKPIPEYDPAAAKKLLKEAGYPDGMKCSLAFPNGYPDVVRWAEVIKEDARAGGFDITLEPMPNSQYWEKYKDNPLGITTWAHRPLGTMILNLVYSVDDDGNPVDWNETRWVDKEFNEILRKANGILDVEKRRELFCKLEEIQMTRGTIGLSYWCDYFVAAGKHVQNFEGHPSGYIELNKVWLKS
jgi:peptide/nickel transport system substrate-binding protein